MIFNISPKEALLAIIVGKNMIKISIQRDEGNAG